MYEWYQLHITDCHPEMVEVLSEILENIGALSISLSDTYDNPILEPEPGTTPLWSHITLAALFDEPSLADLAKTILGEQYPKLQLQILTLSNEDWLDKCKQDFQAQKIGSRLWICPSWSPAPDPNACSVILDPGLAFGTGSHPTTKLCLQWLDTNPLENKSLIDYGCGSGILAIAALKLGAAKAYAVDIDSQALQATENNAKTNGIREKQLHVGFPNTLDSAVDIVIANILLAPLIGLKDTFYQLIKRGGILIVSGILSEQVPSLVKAYSDRFKLKSNHNSEGWCLLVFCRGKGA